MLSKTRIVYFLQRIDSSKKVEGDLFLSIHIYLYIYTYVCQTYKYIDIYLIEI